MHRAFLALALVVNVFTGAVAKAERAGAAAQVVRSVDLRKTPDDDGASLGRLPKGTVLTLTGEAKNGFASVEVELEDGNVEGWVPRESLNRAARESIPEDPRGEPDEDEDEEPVKPKKRVRSDAPEDEERVVTRPRSRIRVPKDEGLLLRRDTTFFYGVQAGGGITMMEADISNEMLMGPAFTAGGHIGYNITNTLSARLEMAYQSVRGSDPAGKFNDLAFGFFDSNLSLSYFIENIELFGGFGYAYGIALSDIPAGLKLTTAADLSTLSLQGGLGYRIFLNDVTSLVIRARYAYGFTRSPVGISPIQGFLFLEFRG